MIMDKVYGVNFKFFILILIYIYVYMYIIFEILKGCQLKKCVGILIQKYFYDQCSLIKIFFFIVCFMILMQYIWMNFKFWVLNNI